MDFYTLSFFGGWSGAQFYIPVLQTGWSLGRLARDFRGCGGIWMHWGNSLSGTTLRHDKRGNQCEGYYEGALGHGQSPYFLGLIFDCKQTIGT